MRARSLIFGRLSVDQTDASIVNDSIFTRNARFMTKSTRKSALGEICRPYVQ